MTIIKKNYAGNLYGKNSLNGKIGQNFKALQVKGYAMEFCYCYIEKTPV